VPASSVKGALRSLLSMLLNVPSEDRQQFLAFVLEKEKVDWNKKQLEDFISDSFGSQSQKGKDIFLDAFPVAQEDSKGEKTHQPFVGSDSITPHKGALKNPTPLTFLKILPNVSIKFAFFLKPYSIKGIEVISITEKERLFENLLSNYGIGAKTNVGYGQFK
jgi:CRISPR-associated protein Cmr6